MKRRFIQMLGLLLSGVMVLSMAGCAQKTAQSNTQEAATAETEAADTKEAESAETTDSAPENTDDYANNLFDTSYVHTIDIEIADEDWQDLLANPTDKTKYEVNVTVDDNVVEDVSFATKGNTSLSSVADSDSDRYSFKINFGKYVDDQTYGGLTKLNLNNIYSDATYMKDYVSYRIFQEAGSYAPEVSYVWVTINGEAWGLYLAVEEIGDSWLTENTDGEGELYKPETSMLGNMGKGGPGKDEKGDGEDRQGPPDMGDMPEFTEEMKQAMENGEFPGGFGEEGKGGPGGGFGGFGGSNSGASLAYTDDEISSYSDIFDNAETDVTEEDEQRLIAALKGLSEASGEELEDYLNTDEIIRYFVAHNFVMNYDSYTGNMLHNYFLYENDGKLSMIPWDYNLAFGNFMNQGGPGGGNPFEKQEDTEEAGETGEAESENRTTGASYVINYGIDTPLSGAEVDDRPMWAWIAENEAYLEQYHAAFDELLSNYFESGDFDAEMEQVYEMILPYVEQDPTAFITVEEFQTGFETLKSFCDLRAESIRKQLEGTLSTSTDDQDETAWVDGSSITISDMGSQMGGDKGGPSAPTNN